MKNIESVKQQSGVRKFYYFSQEKKTDEIERELDKESVLRSIVLEVIPFLEGVREQPISYFSVSSEKDVIMVVKNSGNTGVVVADENANIGLLRIMINKAIS